MEFKLKWTPNPNMPYPNTWLPFKAKDLHSDNLVDYRICDLPENRYEDFLKVFDDDFLQHEPIHSTLDNVIENNPEGVEAFKIISKAAHKQKLIDVCINDRSNEICGFNILFVICKGDNADDQLRQLFANDVFQRMQRMDVLYGDFDVFEHYNVDSYLASLALCVAKKYERRGIGRKLLEARKLIGLAHGFKIQHSTFTSVYSNRLADEVGFTLDREMRWDRLRAINPTIPFNDVYTAKTWILK